MYRILFILIILTNQINSQHTLTGSINIEENPAKGISVFLLDKDNKFIKTTRTNNSGYFIINDISTGVYNIKVTLLGYNTIDIKGININKDLKLEKQKLVVKNKKLKDVIISAKKYSKASELQTKTYSPSQFVGAQNGNASDMLSNLPSVEVSSDNSSISLRGDENVTIFINGKQSQISTESLAQIPANQIEKIEVITNPTAKNASEGSGGAINIILKESNEDLNNGYFVLGVGNNNQAFIQSGYNININKFNISLGYNFKYEEFNNFGYSKRRYLNGDVYNTTNINFDGIKFEPSHFSRLGIDYRINKYNKIYSSYSISRAFENSYSTNIYETLDQNKIDKANWNRNFYENNENLFYDVNFSYEFEPEKIGNKTVFSFSNNGNINWVNNDINQTYHRYNFINPYDSLDKLFIYNFQRRTTTIFGLDNKYTINPKNTINMGFGLTMRDFRYTTESSQNINNGLELTPNPNISNNFNYEENVNAGYIELVSQLTYNLKSNVGLRAEQTNTNSTNYDSIPLAKYNYFNFFPSAFLTYNITDKHMLNLSYSRRINRPGPGQLNPLQNVEDPQSNRLGNPKLRPEIISSFELGYGGEINNDINYSTSIFYKNFTNSITRFITFDENGVLNLFVDNIGEKNSYGVEAIGSFKTSKKLKFGINSNFNFTNLQYSTDIKQYNIDYFNWNTRLITNYKFSNKLDIQSILNYRSDFKTPQGTIQSVTQWDMALRYKILDNNGILSLSISDILDDRRFNILVSDDTFKSEYLRKRQSRIAVLSFRYNFGSQKNPTKEFSNHKNGGDGEGGGM